MAEYLNDTPNLLTRLLELLPREALKNEFGCEGNKSSIIKQILKDTTTNDIYEDVVRLMSYCKQYVHFFNHDCKDLKSVGTDFLKNDVVYKNVAEDTPCRVVVEYIISLNFNFKEVVGETAKDKKLTYYWPIKVILTPSYLEIHIVIMEKTRINANGRFFTGRSLTEEQLIMHICGAKKLTNPTRVYDINKGIKYLWDNNCIDSIVVSHKNIESLDKTTMDSEKTFKLTYPKEYTTIRTHPLEKTTFKTINSNPYPSYFLSEPTQGKLSFFIFPDDKSHIDSLLSAILLNN